MGSVHAAFQIVSDGGMPARGHTGKPTFTKNITRNAYAATGCPETDTGTKRCHEKASQPKEIPKH